MLFADDWDFVAEGANFERSLLGALWVLHVFGFPIKWRKCRGGFVYTWVGYEKSLREWALGISARRAQWLEGWFAAVLDAGSVHIKEFREALGRMVFVYGALEYDKPFLAPLFAFVAVSPPHACVQLPVYVRMVLKWLLSRLRVRRLMPCAMRRSQSGVLMRVDAKAAGLEVVVGGWEPVLSLDGCPLPSKSRWFSTKLTQENAPWAFERGLPYKCISALELLATTVALVAFGPLALDEGGVDALVAVTGFTDSQVSSDVVTKGMTTSFPLCCVLMELAAQLESRRARLDLDWCPREVNQEADDLTNDLFDAFDPALRVTVEMQQLPWLVFPALMKEGLEYYREVRSVASQRVRPCAGRLGQASGRHK